MEIMEYQVLLGSPYSFASYYTSVVNIISRHPHVKGYLGYMAPIGQGAWVAVAFTLASLVAILSISSLAMGNGHWSKVIIGCFSIFNISALQAFQSLKVISGGNVIKCCQNKDLGTYFIGRLILLLMILFYYIFYITYNQALVSSTIEPEYEKMPNTLDNIKTQYQHVMNFGPAPNMDILIAWNTHILKSFNIIQSKNSTQYFTNALSLVESRLRT